MIVQIVQIAQLISHYHKLNDHISIIVIINYTEEIKHKVIPYVCLNSRYNIIKRTIQRFQSYIRNFGGYLFIVIVQKLRIDVMELFIENGADIHALHDFALGWAAESNHIDIVKLLLEKGADIHATHDYALRWASYHGHLEIVKLLLEKGADLHADNDCALEWAAEHGHLEIVKLLVENGANPHARNNGPLRWASFHDHLYVVDFLKPLCHVT